MGSNVFVSYKYKDSNVRKIGDISDTTCRDYVDEIQKMLEGMKTYYFRGEEDGECLSDLYYDTISGKLADKMFYTSLTIVLISSNMRVPLQRERDQWIPWEISYSLREKTRSSGNSGINAVLAVVIPDINGSYSFAIKESGDVRTIFTDRFFNIIGRNMFNHKKIDKFLTTDGHYNGPISYIPIVKWSDFKSNPEKYLKEAESRRDHSDDYNLVKKIDPSW